VSAASEKLWLQELSWPEVEQVLERTTTILLPMGSTEQHGPHLAEGTDTYVPSYIAESVARATGVPIAPPLWLTTCESHMGFAGTISLRPTTVIALLRDVCGSLARHGFRDFVLLNGHLGGAHPALLSAADEIQLELPEVKLWDIDLNAIAIDELREICDSDVFPHAEELEVSQMLAIRPDLVDIDKAVDFEPGGEGFIGSRLFGGAINRRSTGAEFREHTPSGIIGLATHGTAEKGHEALAAQARQITAFVQELRELRRSQGGLG
jgi:creatinine amidohydrolase